MYNQYIMILRMILIIIIIFESTTTPVKCRLQYTTVNTVLRSRDHSVYQWFVYTLILFLVVNDDLTKVVPHFLVFECCNTVVPKHSMYARVIDRYFVIPRDTFSPSGELTNY
mgnify:CR=1 FL=1